MLLESPLDKNIDDYDLYTASGINVYVDCRIIAKNDTIKIEYKKILFAEKYVVSGVIN